MTIKEAALRVIQEINFFSDQSGYIQSTDLIKAKNLLAYVFGLTPEEFRSYAPEET